jgi:DNA-binding XRE family transcriptional regulator
MQDRWPVVAETVKRRRLELDLSQRAAAIAADTSPTTWGNLEKHSQRVDPLSRTKICRALGWTLDSIDRILDGGEPEEAEGFAPLPSMDEVAGRLTTLEEGLAGLRADVRAQLERIESTGP